jgi:hypothetical protein
MVPAGATVRAGYYFNRDELDLIAIAGPEGTLPGNSGQRYYPVPTLAVLGVTPLLGVLFVILVPIIPLVLALGQRGHASSAGTKARIRRWLSLRPFRGGRPSPRG